MTGQITVTGMVLSAMPIGDYDKRIVILTTGRGKISCFARGARKPSSPFLACTQPFTFGDFTLYAGRNSYNMVSAEVKNYFSELRNDIAAIYYGMYFCELAEYFTNENNDEKDTLKLLYQSLRALSNASIGVRLVRAVFELKIISINGFSPQVFECVVCGNAECIHKEGMHILDINRGGILCSECKKISADCIEISSTAVYTMQYIIATAPEKLFNFALSKETLLEMEHIIKEYMKAYIDKKFSTLDVIDVIL